MWRHHVSCSHQSVDGHRGCFHFSAVTDEAARNICVQVLVWVEVLISLGFVFFPWASNSTSYSLAYFPCPGS